MNRSTDVTARRRLAPIAAAAAAAMACILAMAYVVYGAGATTATRASDTHGPDIARAGAPSAPANVPTTGVNFRRGEGYSGQPPLEPPIASRNTTAGLLAFGRFYLQAMDWDYKVASSAYTDDLSLPTCIPCNQDHAFFRMLYVKHEHYSGGWLTLESAHLATQAGFPPHTVTVVASVALFINSRFFHPQHPRIVPRTVGEGNAVDNVHFNVTARWTDGAWQVADYTVSTPTRQ